MENKYPTNLVTCRFCGKKDINRNTQEEGVVWCQTSPRFYYHIDCYEKQLAGIEKKRKKEITEEQIPDAWLESVYYYLQQDLKIVCNYAKLYKEWKRLIQKGRTPKGIYFALKYFYDVKHGDTSKSGGSIGIVDYIYDEAKNYWENIEIRNNGIVDKLEQEAQKNKIKLSVAKIEYFSNKKKKQAKYTMEDDDD